MKLAVVADVHGEAVSLAAALAEPRLSDRTIVLVGDYVNRGPDSDRVLDLLVTERNRLGDRLVLLEGNHDRAFLEVLRTGRGIAGFLAMGGDHTIRSYLAPVPAAVLSELRGAVPVEHVDLLENLRHSFESEGVFVTHSLDQIPSEVAAASDVTVVVGHHVQRNGPTSNGNVVFIDAGCGTIPGGPLTVFLIPEFEFLTF